MRMRSITTAEDEPVSEEVAKRALTDKQRLFVEEYLVDLNATQAAIRAGYNPNSARIIASQNLTKPYIQEAIQEAIERRVERTRINQDKVLTEYARISFSDIRDYLEWDGGRVVWKDSSTLDDDSAAAIQEVSESITENGRTRKFKLYDKQRALTDLAKHLNLFPTGPTSATQVNVSLGERGRDKEEITVTKEVLDAQDAYLAAIERAVDDEPGED